MLDEGGWGGGKDRLLESPSIYSSATPHWLWPAHSMSNLTLNTGSDQRATGQVSCLLSHRRALSSEELLVPGARQGKVDISWQQAAMQEGPICLPRPPPPSSPLFPPPLDTLRTNRPGPVVECTSTVSDGLGLTEPRGCACSQGCFNCIIAASEGKGRRLSSVRRLTPCTANRPVPLGHINTH